MANSEQETPSYEVIINMLFSLRNRMDAVIESENTSKRLTQVTDNQNNKKKRS